jgi:1-acyl-sn-glycerol-3-phosphate acyltransferase
MTPSPDFYPPKLRPWLVRLLQWCAPPLARWLYWVDVEVSEAELQQLAQLKGDRVLLLPNHPTFHDPIVMFLLSAKARRLFYYLAAYETFDDPSTMFLISAGFKPLHRLAQSERFKKLLRWLLQQLGMYSIRRGLADRPSIAQTLALLAEPDCHLVIFPEGGCSFQNDTVMPFRPGGIQMAFQTLNKQSKREETVPNLYVIPVTIKYHYTGDMTPVIERSLSALEKALDIVPEQAASAYMRLRAIAERVLTGIEADYGLTSAEHVSQNWNDRIQTLKQRVIESCEQQLSLTPPPGEMIRERVYKIQHLLNTSAEVVDEQLQWSHSFVEKTMIRLLNFDAIYDGYVAADPTPERFLDTLIRLEREVFNIDQPPPKGHRIAKITLATPYNLKTEFEDYQHSRAATIDRMVSKIHRTVQRNLG